jgi:steroid 5-alpha reductase family enzyme
MILGHLSNMRKVVSIVGGLNAAGWVTTAALETHKITDLIGVGSFGVAAISLHQPGLFQSNPRAFFMNTIVMVWSARLSTFLFSRVMKLGEDKRLAKFFREKGEGYLDKAKSFFPVKLISFWSIQAAWGILCMLPITLVHTAKAMPVNAVGFVGLAVAAAGVFIEAVADHQKNTFKTAKPEAFCTEGLWRFSRHPNYAGELMTWWGLFAAAAPCLTLGQGCLAILSPLTITGLLLKVSGIPLLEKQYEKRYGDSEKYQEYKTKTPLLFPFL